MAKNLVIVESPSKSKTIEKYLGKDYKVTSSKGHIRDLATTGKFGLGVDIENNFEPNYVPIKGKAKTITELKKATKDVDKVYLATDPDREGEAISFHLKEALNIDDKDYERVIFNEITKKAVLDAFIHPRKIDDQMVRSQETRRILDRIIGFRLSKLMQRKTGGKSAGRVQSVALKLIVDREREIDAFIPEEYWEIIATFPGEPEFDAKLEKYKNKKIEIPNEAKVRDVLEELGKSFKIESVEKKEKAKRSKPAFITSTLQQTASSKLGFSAKKTMMVAQKLYEGIDLGKETTGLITYMRTDSIRLSEEFVRDAKSYIRNTYGEEYIGYVKEQKEKDNVQDAHEGIRPTDITKTPEKIKPFLTDEQYKLYNLVYKRALASLMKDAKVNATSVILDNNGYKFKATGNILIFDGYLKVYKEFEQNEDKILPEFENYKSNIILSKKIEESQHFTTPPARYTEAKLIKEMEELGIGRPSTYAATMDTIKNRGYVLIEDKKFVPTEMGTLTTDKLQESFDDIINVEYTAYMEKELDGIAEGTEEWHKVLKEFWEKFEPEVKKAMEEMEKVPLKETGDKCPNCGSPMVIRNGRYGEFEACSNYPECKYIKKEKQEEKIICDCLSCKGKIVEKKTRKGKIFYGCNSYPKCKEAYWDKPTGDKCPECNSMLIEKNGEIKCSSCEYKRE